jgi:hypothetical protein
MKDKFEQAVRLVHSKDTLEDFKKNRAAEKKSNPWDVVLHTFDGLSATEKEQLVASYGWWGVKVDDIDMTKNGTIAGLQGKYYCESSILTEAVPIHGWWNPAPPVMKTNEDVQCGALTPTAISALTGTVTVSPISSTNSLLTSNGTAGTVTISSPQAGQISIANNNSTYYTSVATVDQLDDLKKKVAALEEKVAKLSAKRVDVGCAASVNTLADAQGKVADGNVRALESLLMRPY